MAFTGVSKEMARLRAEIKRLEKDAVAEVRRATLAAVNTMYPITPVNTGETVRNYAVGIGRPNTSYKTPTGIKEATNKLDLGAEANRAENVAASRADIMAALAGLKKLSSVFITNNIDDNKWNLIESGNAPGEPFINRGPGGQSSIAAAAVRNGSEGKWR